MSYYQRGRSSGGGSSGSFGGPSSRDGSHYRDDYSNHDFGGAPSWALPGFYKERSRRQELEKKIEEIERDRREADRAREVEERVQTTVTDALTRLGVGPGKAEAATPMLATTAALKEITKPPAGPAGATPTTWWPPGWFPGWGGPVAPAQHAPPEAVQAGPSAGGCGGGGRSGGGRSSSRGDRRRARSDSRRDRRRHGRSRSRRRRSRSRSRSRSKRPSSAGGASSAAAGEPRRKSRQLVAYPSEEDPNSTGRAAEDDKEALKGAAEQVVKAMKVKQQFLKKLPCIAADREKWMTVMQEATGSKELDVCLKANGQKIKFDSKAKKLERLLAMSMTGEE